MPEGFRADSESWRATLRACTPYNGTACNHRALAELSFRDGIRVAQPQSESSGAAEQTRRVPDARPPRSRDLRRQGALVAASCRFILPGVTRDAGRPEDARVDRQH